MDILPKAQEHALEEANRALSELKQRKIRDAKVLRSADGRSHFQAGENRLYL
jgi:hypothetical protein